MRPLSFVLVVVLLLPVLASGGAAGQQVNATNSTEGPTIGVEVVNENKQNCDETIDKRTALCSSSVDSSGQMTLVLYSKMYQKVTLTDGGAFRKGGQVPQRGFTLQEGRNRIQWQLTEYRGYSVAISTQSMLYAEHITRSESFLPGSPQPSDPAIAALTMFMLFACGFPAAYIGVNRWTGGVRDEL